MTKVSEVYSTLYHYTDFQGLLGILQNNSLWATHFKFLNDKKEIILFMEECLPSIIYPHVRKKFFEILKENPDQKKLFDENGMTLEQVTEHDVVAQIKALFAPVKEQIYITSFCGEHKHNDQINNHGLLSQWRGYGENGGFAIVFDSKGIEECLAKESENFSYLYATACDVLYSEDEIKSEPEFSEYIQDIVRICEDLIEASLGYKELNSSVDNPNIVNSFLSSISRYKHWGFSEEKEVRVVMTPASKDWLEPDNNQKAIKYREKKGEWIPYIELFESPNIVLPIKKIIVGPHKEKESRAAYLKTRLVDTNIEIAVSDIPYIG